jgi:hypothetical protein
MGELVVSMVFTLVLMWGGRDKVSTPKFDGTSQERFAQGFKYYGQTMGLEGEFKLVLDAGPHKKYCSDVQYVPLQRVPVVGFDAFTLEGGYHLVRFYDQTSACKRVKPEQWAMHEACHVRYAHTRPSTLTPKQKEEEVEKCMKVYSKNERQGNVKED